MALTITIVFIAVVFIGVESYCINGWTRYADSCYLFEDLVSKTWAQADRYCRDQDAHLVMVGSAAENTFIKHELQKLHPGTEDQFWTDGNDIDSENHWVWGKSNNSIVVTFWHPGEPNQKGGQEDCLTYYTRYNFDWNDDHCDKSFSFICEIEDPEEMTIIG